MHRLQHLHVCMFTLHTTQALETPITTGPMTPSPPNTHTKTSSQLKFNIPPNPLKHPKTKSPLKHPKPHNPLNTLNHPVHWDTPNHEAHWNTKKDPVHLHAKPPSPLKHQNAPTPFVYRWVRVRLDSGRVIWLCWLCCHVNTNNINMKWFICNSYTMGCPPVLGDNPRALASGIWQTRYNYFIPPKSV